MERKLNDLQVYLPIIAMKHWFVRIVHIALQCVYICDKLRIPTLEFGLAIFHDIVSFKAHYTKCGDF